MVSGGTTPNPLSRYVPRLLIEWLRDAPDTHHRIITGTCVFADLSGYTAMTERLAAQGTAGAEETGEILNDVFEALLSAAYDFGAGLVKWGGDAVLLLFHGEAHAVRATRAAWVMQNTIARVGKVSTSRGPMRVRMSVGIHTGDFHFMLVGRHFQDLVVAGPAMTATARMEAIADPGEVVLSDATAAFLEPDSTRLLPADCHLLITPPDAPLLPRHSALQADVDLGGLFDPVLRDHLMASRGDFEHRAVAAAFVAFGGTDDLLDAEGTSMMYAAIDDLVSHVQEIAAEHGVVLLTTDLAEDGGKFLLVSGVPNKPGDDAARVLATATSVVNIPTRLTLRAGVTYGRVFAGDFGAPFRGTYSLAGDVINLAARLAYSAEDRQVLTTADVLDHTDGSFMAHSRPPVTVKGKSDPVHPMSVTRRATVDVAAHAQLPLIGRDAELATLVAAEAGASEGHGVALDVVGVAGIGKSRLIAEYESVAAVPVVRVDGDLYAPTRPYASVRHLLRSALDVGKTADAGVVGEALTAAVSSVAPHLTPWLPLLAIAAGAAVPATAEVDALDSTTRAERLRRVTSELLGAVLTSPTALVFNDTHAMDDASVGLIRQLCSDVQDRPWSIVIARRPEARVESTFPNSRAVALDTLTIDDADALVVAASTIRIPAPRRAELSERSGGNPLFLRALAETVSAGRDPDVLPSEIEDVLSAHMDRLSPEERGWLRTASVLGTRVDPDLLTEITDEPFDPSGSPRLSEYIRPEPDGMLVFAHHLIQRTAYEALPFRRRRTLHARASYAIERRAGDNLDDAADVLAIHCLRGQRFDAAWQYARTAGRRARERYALSEAAASFEVALEAAGSIPGLPAREVAAVAEDLAELRFAMGQNEQTEHALALARRAARDDHRRSARICLLTSRQRHSEGRYPEALRWITRGRALLDPTNRDDLRLLAELAECASGIHQTRGSVQKLRTWAETATDEARRCGDTQLAASALSQLAIAKAQAGETWDPVDMAESTSWNLKVLGEITNRLGVAAYYAGDLATAEFRYAEAEVHARKAGQESKAAVYLANRAEVLVNLQRFEEALPLLDRVIDELRSTQSNVYLPFALALMAQATYGARGADAALPIFEAAHQHALEFNDSDVVTESASWIGRIGRDVSNLRA
ncbi:hypothetical protein Back2_22410 [Nocardioides baekrokdamisoli]|uniref:Guanylate cyclase domain-containing protein n=1 Tax=Nocardioides baekrokdamisoli TaxID=1804624 RepID=A0A3G9J3E8_9ACTN|nr:adenylate/guanylate cyclase domain-containing protein [Nocardioides baekrokdamisoli]BBH17954.1 hypothetical protein Back2_22410 [Nocardioides baekrokdamisoli]